jgi:hypothetical protein
MTNVTPFKREPSKPDFVCIDCGHDVYVYPARPLPDAKRCLTCQWLANIKDPAERETLRRWYRELGE